VLVGLVGADDAGVYRISDDTALVQTVDFITPIVDDPAVFGRIAAANSLSDVWAMGGRPLCAMNVVCFPSEEMEIDVLRKILEGGLSALREAGTALVGGHSVDDRELKYGLSVTGLVHPERFLTNRGARPGDALVLTKPLGTGIVATAVKGGLGTPEASEAAAASMSALNGRASELMLERGPSACTDVTGFGLVGHAAGMIEEGRVGLVLEAGALPLLPGVEAFAGMGLVPAGLHRNREHYACRTKVEAGVPEAVADAVHDPQTSGGLLVALPPEAAADLAAALRGEGHEKAAVIGAFTADNAGKILVRA